MLCEATGLKIPQIHYPWYAHTLRLMHIKDLILYSNCNILAKITGYIEYNSRTQGIQFLANRIIIIVATTWN